MRAFGEDQSFSRADVRRGRAAAAWTRATCARPRAPDAVRALVAGRQPLFEFVIRTTPRRARPGHRRGPGRRPARRCARRRAGSATPPCGRSTRACSPAGSGWIGESVRTVDRRRRDARAADGRPRGRPGRRPTRPRSAGRRRRRPRRPARAEPDRRDPGRPDRRDPVANLERQALEVVLQQPLLVPTDFDSLAADAFAVPAFRAVHEAIRAAGGVAAAGAAGRRARGRRRLGRAGQRRGGRRGPPARHRARRHAAAGGPARRRWRPTSAASSVRSSTWA